ncbi:hypothetical protein GLOIN_2v1486032 [Rhizophagus clarus]|uniref:Uncharacterized protein n=1 Tax=Rhizophagus clarus TaxID=94130 RepID=A0A8H3QW15_9GLOM|nr:hypothetical protein GLOIN_2v1486032 [Rhizophagus clarus]
MLTRQSRLTPVDLSSLHKYFFIPEQTTSMEQESGSKEHSAFKYFLHNIANKNNTNAQKAHKLLDNWKGIKCSLEVENFWNNHKKTQELRQEIHPVKVYNELKLFQIESEDLNYALEGSKNLNFTTIETKENRKGTDAPIMISCLSVYQNGKSNYPLKKFERIINITNECSMMQESSPK